MMAENEGAIVFYGTTWCPDCRRAQRVMDQYGVPFRWVDIDKDPEAASFVKEVNRGNRSVPTIVFSDGSILVEPSNAALKSKLGVQR